MHSSDPQPRILKSDAFGSIAVVRDGERVFIRRDIGPAHWWLKGLACWAAAREARVMRVLQGIDGVPALLAWDGKKLDRSYIAGQPMQLGQPRDVDYYRHAHRLIRALRDRGVVHNDLAKEPNWLVRDDGTPAVVDFQIAWATQRRGGLFRLLAREDLRHLLKHKRMYCPQAITPVERRVLAKRSWIAASWNATGKRGYKFIARRLFGYWDNEGEGRVRR